MQNPAQKQHNKNPHENQTQNLKKISTQTH